MFKDRSNAGKKLGGALEKYRGKNALILAIPKGGIEVGYEVAKKLQAELSVIITRKLPMPYNPESGFGAVAEDGSSYIIKRISAELNNVTIMDIRNEQLEEIERRKKILRNNRPLPDMRNRTVILVDDGIAMGSTMLASIKLCINKKAGKIVAAAPVGGPDKPELIGREANDVVILETPPDFHAVAQVYENWYDVSDEEAVEILNRKI